MDTFTSLGKQYRLLHAILLYGEKGRQALDGGANLSDVIDLPVRERIGRAKFIPEDESERQLADIENELNGQIGALLEKGGL